MTINRDYVPRRRPAWAAAALLMGVHAAAGGMLHAADPPPIQLPNQTPRDFVTTNAARRVLQKDEQLAALNLGVSVNNRVATVWGNVPSAEVGRKVEARLKEISGIAAVMNECRIVGDDPVPQAIADAVKKARAEGDEANVSAKFGDPPPPMATTSRVVAKPSTEEVAPKPKGDVNEVAPGAPLLPPPPVTVLLAPIPVEEAGNLEDWEQVRRSQPRFKDLTLDVKDGVVKVSGVVLKMKDAWDLAERLNTLPQVRQVIMGNVVEK